MKKTILFLTCIIILISLTSAIQLDITSKPISKSVIIGFDRPAQYELKIRNLGEDNNFEIYSLVGVDITPETFSLEPGKTKTLTIEAMPHESYMKSHKGHSTFEYKIKNSEKETQKEELTINSVDLSEVLAISPQNINPKAETVTISIENNIDKNLSDLKLKMSSAFFETEKTPSIKSKEIKKIEIPLDNSSKSLKAGNYLLNTEITLEEETTELESIIKYLEQEGIETISNEEGFIVNKKIITKRNVGNTKKTIEVSVNKNFIAYLFTTFNIAPTETNTIGLSRQYTWKKELIPNEEIKIKITTNWFYPIIVILLAIALFILIKRQVEKDLSLRKKVSFVKTKGGQFALKVTLKARAKKYLERINITDKLPPLVNLYERYGAITPDKVDLKNRRIEWNIESLDKDEERIFSYIIYSKIGVVGKFELPYAKATYEKQGKVKETSSNRSFFINKPKNKEE